MAVTERPRGEGRPLRVVLDGRHIRSQPSGIGWYTIRLAAELARLGVDLLLVGPSSQDLARLRAGDEESLPISTIPLRGHSLSVAGHLRLRQILRSSRADLYHCPYLPFPGLWGKVPVVLTVHDLIPILFPEAVQGSLKGRCPGLFSWLYGRAVRLARRIIVVSRYTAGDLQRCFPAAEGKTDVVWNGIQAVEPMPRPRRQKVLDRLGVEPPYVLCVSRRDPYKRVDLLVRAFARCRESIAGRLVLVGSPDRRFPEVETAIRETGLGDRVRVLGYVGETELRALYGGARLVAHPSIYEGFGFPPLEAMTHGVPVVASRASAIPEVVGDAALLVEPDRIEALANGLVRLWQDESLRATLVTRGRQRIERFSWRETARRTLEVYRSAMGVSRDGG